MKKKYPVVLDESEREELKRLIAAGTAPARKLTHARILLKADRCPEGPAWVDDAVAQAVQRSQPSVSRVRKLYLEEGPEAALNRRPPDREYRRKLDGEQEARLVALACSEPPEGRARWSLRLLADELVGLEVVEEEVSYQRVRRALKKTDSSPTRGSGGRSRPRPTRSSSGGWRTFLGSTLAPTIRSGPRSVWMGSPSNCSGTPAHPCR